MSKTYSYENYPCDGVEDRITRDFNFIHYGKEKPSQKEMDEVDERVYHTKELESLREMVKEARMGLAFILIHGEDGDKKVAQDCLNKINSLEELKK